MGMVHHVGIQALCAEPNETHGRAQLGNSCAVHNVLSHNYLNSSQQPYDVWVIRPILQLKKWRLPEFTWLAWNPIAFMWGSYSSISSLLSSTQSLFLSPSAEIWMYFCLMQAPVHLRVANILPELSLLLDKLDCPKLVFLGPNHMATHLQVAEGHGYCITLFHLQTNDLNCGS